MNPSLAPSRQMSQQEVIDWAAADVSFDRGWDNQNPPNGWTDNQAAVARCVAGFMVKLEYGNGGGWIKATYEQGYTRATVTKGFHQREQMFSFLLGHNVTICHLTVRLFNKRNKYCAIHLYFTATGQYAGGTLWDEINNRPVS